MAYTKTNWKDLPSEDTPIVSTALNNIENGIEELDTVLNSGWYGANETWTYASVDDPTGVITISGDVTTKYSLGMRIKFTNGGNTIYGIITKLAYSSPNTTMTFLHEIDPTDSSALHLMANSAITANYYSTMKVPYGFPIESNKWSIKVVNSSSSYRFDDLESWVNTGGINITIPIGFWDLYFVATPYGEYSGGGLVEVYLTLSTTSSSESDKELTTGGSLYTAGPAVYVTRSKAKQLSLSSKTTYYMNLKGKTGMFAVGLFNINASAVIIAKCIYL